MEPQAQFGLKDVLTHMIADMAKAVSDRPNESTEQQSIRTRVATQMILGLQPRDVMEAMLAGHGVMMHAVMTDSIHETLRGQPDNMRRGTRANIVALNRAFFMNVDRLEKCQRDRAEAAQTAEVRAPIAARVKPQPVLSASPSAETTILLQAKPEVIAAARANPEAMAALEAVDAARFARAMGMEVPGEIEPGPPGTGHPDPAAPGAEALNQAGIPNSLAAVPPRIATL